MRDDQNALYAYALRDAREAARRENLLFAFRLREWSGKCFLTGESVTSATGTYSEGMLLLVDLDNTLVDRAFAFDLWASDFVRSLGGANSETAWLIAADRDGYEPRESLARAIEERFETSLGVETLTKKLLFDHVSLMTLEFATAQALQNARESGWRIGIITNGTAAQQTLKIDTVGLEPYVDAVVISEAEGVKKPDTELFEIAACRLGAEVAGGWMVGDHPTADISGGRAAGLRTGWVSRGKEWPGDIPAPDLSAATAAEVIDAVVGGLTQGPVADFVR